MNSKELNTLLKKLNIRYAYDHFSSPVTEDKYLVFFETGKDQSFGDNKTYFHDSDWAIELYTKKKDWDLEDQLIELLDENEIPWSGGATTYIDSEKIYMTVFYI